MSRRRISIEVRKRIFVARGWQVSSLAAGGGIRLVYSGSAGGWMGDRHRLADLLAYFDHRGIAYALDDLDQGELFSDGGAA